MEGNTGNRGHGKQPCNDVKTVKDNYRTSKDHERKCTKEERLDLWMVV